MFLLKYGMFLLKPNDEQKRLLFTWMDRFINTIKFYQLLKMIENYNLKNLIKIY